MFLIYFYKSILNFSTHLCKVKSMEKRESFKNVEKVDHGER